MFELLQKNEEQCYIRLQFTGPAPLQFVIFSKHKKSASIPCKTHYQQEDDLYFSYVSSKSYPFIKFKFLKTEESSHFQNFLSHLILIRAANDHNL